MKPGRERVTLSVKYKRGALIAANKTSQSMAHLPSNLLIREIELKESGFIERDGKQYLFQTIRLLIEEL